MMKLSVLIGVLVLFATPLFSQPPEAETAGVRSMVNEEVLSFNQNYWHLYEQKAFAEALRCFSPTALVVVNGVVYPHDKIWTVHNQLRSVNPGFSMCHNASCVTVLDERHAVINSQCYMKQKPGIIGPCYQCFNYMVMLEKDDSVSKTGANGYFPNGWKIVFLSLNEQ
jgi:hypothetical protein